jgi:hypothetical protein
MSSDPRQAVREAIILAEVERSVAKWSRTLPDHMVATLREISEEYYRTDPVAVRVIHVLVEEAISERSGSESGPVAGAAGPAPAKRGVGRG